MRARAGLLLGAALALPAAAQGGAGAALNPPMAIEAQGAGADVQVMTPRAPVRTIDFVTDEATSVSLDVSPDGRWLLMDLLGQLWRLPVAGGAAQPLTQGAGVALNFHPRYAPDGRRIAFVSDRSGQNNIWIINADGSNPRALLLDKDSRFTNPEWAPDGQSIVAVRAFKTPGRSWHRQNETLWQIFLDGRPPVQLKGGPADHYLSPAFSPDGRSLYFDLAFSTNHGNGLLNAGRRLLRYEFASGRTFGLDGTPFTGLDPAFQAALDATGYAEVTKGAAPAAIAPRPSPRGRYLAFAREVPGELFSYRGHRFGPRTALFLRDLRTGRERRLIPEAAKDATRLNAQYSYRVFPGYAWSADERSLFANYGGKLHRIDVATGRDRVIPFTAHVVRVASAQARGRVEIDDRAVETRFPQWPVIAPDGSRAAFTAFGRVWVMDLPGSTPRPLTAGTPDGQQLMPAFSPDGRQIAFASWSPERGGGLWRVPAGGGAAVAVRAEGPKAWAYPEWAPDGASLIATAREVELGPGGQFETAKAFALRAGWSAVRVGVADGVETELAALGGLRPAHFGSDGSVRIEVQRNPDALPRLFEPFPPPEALAATSTLEVLSQGKARKPVLTFAPRTPDLFTYAWNTPTLSPDGSRVLWWADGRIYVAASDNPLFGRGPFDPDPNVSHPGVTEIAGPKGGRFPRWRNDHVIDFQSGARLVSVDLASGTRSEHPVRLSLPRAGGAGGLLLRGATLITMAGSGVQPAADIRIAGARIACVGQCAAEPGDRVMDVSGKYILPGFIDVHAHHLNPQGALPGVLWQRPEFRLDLAYGVTTIVDPAIVSPGAFPIAEAVESGLLRGPRVYSSGDVIIGQGWATGDRVELNGPADARYQVGRRVRDGAIEIKNYRVASRQQQQWLMEAARAAPITVTAEGGPLFADIGMALDGQTGWEHFLADIPLYGDAATFFGKAGINYSPTVIVAGHVNGAKEYWRPRAGLLADPRYTRFADPVRLKADHKLLPDLPKEEFSFPIVAEGLADILHAGGTGTVGEHGEQPGIGTYWELWSYSEALKPLEALRLATINPARFLGLEGSLGSLEAGKIADMLVLDRDPLADIRNTTSLRYVIKAGEMFDAESLEPVRPR